jgi:hypothetical protein
VVDVIEKDVEPRRGNVGHQKVGTRYVPLSLKAISIICAAEAKERGRLHNSKQCENFIIA